MPFRKYRFETKLYCIKPFFIPKTNFLVKDHPFIDGCKRIAATLFLEFLNRNHALIKNQKIIISNYTLVAITVLTAKSKLEEKETIIKLIMNFLS